MLASAVSKRGEIRFTTISEIRYRAPERRRVENRLLPDFRRLNIDLLPISISPSATLDRSFIYNRIIQMANQLLFVSSNVPYKLLWNERNK